MGDEVGHQLHHLLARRHLVVEQGERFGRLAAQNFLGETRDRLFARETKDVEHVALRDRFAAKRDELIEHRLRIAQAAIRAARDRVSRRRLQLHLLLPGDELQMLRDQIRGNPMQIETLATAQNGRQHLLRLGRGKDELHVLGRLFERLEQRIEGLRGEHVHFVDHVDFVFPLDRRITNVVAQLAHLLDAVVARAVDLEHVETVAPGDLLAAVANAARRDGRPVNAVERLGENARGRGLPDPARPDKKISVRETILFDRILERARDMRLADQIVERLRPIFARENLVAHAPNLVRRG